MPLLDFAFSRFAWAARETIIEQFYETKVEEAILLEELEDIIATEIEDENGGFEEAADRYANQG